MSKLNWKISLEEEKEFQLKTKSLFRPRLKQIGNAIFEVRTHYMSGGINVAPSNYTPKLADVRVMVLRHLEEDSFLFKKNIVTGFTIGNPAPQEPCLQSLLVLMDSLALAIDFEISPRPSDVQCDILLVICGQPVIVLTLVDGDKDSEAVKMYNASVARGVRSTLRRFMDESINIVFGVLRLDDMDTMGTFKTAIKTLAKECALFTTSSSFVTSPSSYEKIVTAFWAGVAETRSVISSDGQGDTDFLRFLTKDQCIILVENINNREVEVQSQPGTGATTLMIELARRLAKLDNTLLVCRSKEIQKRLRAKDLTVLTVEDLGKSDLSKYTNIVDETGTVTGQFGGKIWKSYTEAERQSLKHNIKMFEMENSNKEKMLHLLYSCDRQDKYKHLSREFETLKLFDISFQGLLSAYHLPESFALEVLPVKHSTSGEGERNQRPEAEDYAGHMVDQLKLEIRGRRDLFPLLADMTRHVKGIIPSLHAKLDFLELATSNKPLMKGLGNKADNSMNQDVPSMEHRKHGEKTDWQHKSGSTRSPNTDTEGNPIGQREEKTGGQHKTGSTRSPSTETDENPMGQRGEKTGGQHDLISTNSRAVEKQKYFPMQESKPGETEVMAVDVSEYTDSKKMADLKKSLESLKKEADSKKRELAELREATDHGVEWEYNMECLAEEMSTLKIKEIVTDVIGEDELPVQTEKAGDRSTMIPEVRRGQIYHLREREYGTQKERHILDILKNVIKDDQSRLTNLRTQTDHLECVYGSPIHMVGEIDTNHGGPVSCPPMTFNREWVGAKKLAVSGDGLVNWMGRSLDHPTDRFKNYWGTRSHLPNSFPPPPSTLTAATYWETHSRFKVKKNVSEFVLLEMAVCGEGEVDTSYWVFRQDRSSWALLVGICGNHPGYVCTQVWENRRQVGECLTDTMSPSPGTDVTLKYGITLDVRRGILAFIDVNRGRVLHKFDVNFRESLSPMFYVSRFPDCVHATMRLMSGQEVAMTEEKQQLIAQALFCKQT